MVESGTAYEGDTTTSNQAWQRTATDKRFGFEIPDVTRSKRKDRNKSTVRGLQELAAARRGESIVDTELEPEVDAMADIDLSGLAAADFGVAAEGASDVSTLETQETKETEQQTPFWYFCC